MRRVVSLWLPRFATDRLLRGRWLSSRQQARARPESGSTSGKPAEDSEPLALFADQIGRLTLAAVNDAAASDRKSVVEGRAVSVRVDLGGVRRLKTTKITII